MSKLRYDKYYDKFTKIHFSASRIFVLSSARWLVRAVIQYQDTRFPTEVESGFGILDSQVKSRQSRLIRDVWTLCKGFWDVPGDDSPEKIRNVRCSNCWKCTEIVNLTITVLFCIILNILRSHQADLFGS